MGIDPIEFTCRNLSTSGEENHLLLLDDLTKFSHYEELLHIRSEMHFKFRASSVQNEKLLFGFGVSMRGSSESEADDGTA